MPTDTDRGGRGWHTEYGTEDDRWADPAVAPLTLDGDKKKANEQPTGSIQHALKQGMAQTWGDRAGGGNQSGKFESGSLLRAPKSYADHPGTRILFEVSRLLYNYCAWPTGSSGAPTSGSPRSSWRASPPRRRRRSSRCGERLPRRTTTSGSTARHRRPKRPRARRRGGRAPAEHAQAQARGRRQVAVRRGSGGRPGCDGQEDVRR